MYISSPEQTTFCRFFIQWIGPPYNTNLIFPKKNAFVIFLTFIYFNFTLAV